MSFIVIFITFISTVSCAIDDRRPFYNIAHMVNSIKELRHSLDQGCNAVESDISFASNGTPASVYHGIPCDCFRFCDDSEKISDFLNEARELTTPGHKKYRRSFTLLILDLKTSKLKNGVKYSSGKQMAKILIKDLFNYGKSETKLNVLLSVDSVDDSDFIEGFISELNNESLKFLNDRLGWEVSNDDPIVRIENLWYRIAVIENIWYSDGITNCFSLFRDQNRLRRILRIRDSCQTHLNPYCVRKVYQWTIDYKPQLRLALRRGVDGIITNEARKLKEVLEENEFKDKFRLARSEDSPWTTFR